MFFPTVKNSNLYFLHYINICDLHIIYLKGHETPVTLSAGDNRTVEKIRVTPGPL